MVSWTLGHFLPESAENLCLQEINCILDPMLFSNLKSANQCRLKIQNNTTLFLHYFAISVISIKYLHQFKHNKTEFLCPLSYVYPKLIFLVSKGDWNLPIGADLE